MTQGAPTWERAEPEPNRTGDLVAGLGRTIAWCGAELDHVASSFAL
jgi:hypothetical protein